MHVPIRGHSTFDVEITMSQNLISLQFGDMGKVCFVIAAVGNAMGKR